MANGGVAYSTDFPTPETETWLSLVERTLKGKPFDSAMKRKTVDGIEFPVLHTNLPEKLAQQPVRGTQGWHITSPHWSQDAQKLNEELLTDLERGASAIAITVSSGGQGIEAAQLEAALEGVYLDLVPITLIQGPDFEEGCNAFRQLIEAREYTSGSLSGCLGVDPIGNFARYGVVEELEEPIQQAADIAKHWSQIQPSVSTFNADATVIANAGGSEVQELSFALSSAVAYLRAMEASGVEIETAARQIQFTFSADANLWLTIAKFRAARKLWAQILAACGVRGVDMRLNAVSAVHHVTKRDPWVNILRGTAACFAAGVAGADLVTTLPHDLMLGTTDDFSRRIARNIQIILLEESNLGQVTDPAAGSFALENLTEQLVASAAAAFQSLEAQGGGVSALKTGALPTQIEATAENRLQAVATRKVPITGVSEFPDITEPGLPVGPISPSSARLPLRRPADSFENLRAKSDEVLINTGERPSIFLVNIGTPAEFTARATFAKNFFEAGGIVAIPGDGGDSVESLVKQFASANASIAVLCGTDEQYAMTGTAIISALKEADCKRVYLAGPPKAAPDGSGVDDFAFMGADVIKTVSRAYEAILAEGDAS